MAYDVTSWFLVQLEKYNSEPKRVFKIGTSDYSSHVFKYPKFKRTANDIKSINIDIQMSNEDGTFNGFYEQVYTIPNTCVLQVGFTHPTSGDEFITLYTGFLKNVRYQSEGAKAILKLKDRLYDFTDRKVGDSQAHVDIGSTIPSDIAWALCTSYGRMSSVASTSNPDINYASFLTWAAQFSGDSVLMTANYQGMKVTEALKRMAQMTDSAIWVEGDGKLNFAKFVEPGSLDITFTDENYDKLTIDVESLRLVNKHFTYFDYAVGSNYWQKSIFAINSTSVNTFDLREGYERDKSIWYVDSVGALGLSQRRTNLLNQPPKKFTLEGGLYGMQRQISETVRLVDSFFGITSASGWRLMEAEFNLDSGGTTYQMDEATVMNAFYLDVSLLDGDDLLL